MFFTTFNNSSGSIQSGPKFWNWLQHYYKYNLIILTDSSLSISEQFFDWIFNIWIILIIIDALRRSCITFVY